MSAQIEVQRWYVVYTHPKQEDRAERNLRSWGVETFNPKFKARCFHPYTNTASYVKRILFPRYLFARFNAGRLLQKVSFTRGVHSVVNFGWGPSPVEDELIALLQSRVDENQVIRTHEDLKSGDHVIIKEGSFRNLMGIFEREMEDSERVLILLTAINYQGRVVIEKDRVMKVVA